VGDEQREDASVGLSPSGRADGAAAGITASSAKVVTVGSSRVATIARWVSWFGAVVASLGYLAIYATYALPPSTDVAWPLAPGPVVFLIGWACVIAGLAALRVLRSTPAPSLWLAVWFALAGVALTAAAWAENVPETIGFDWSLPTGVATLVAAALLCLIGLKAGGDTSGSRVGSPGPDSC
jgi:hypothetical protein